MQRFIRSSFSSFLALFLVLSLVIESVSFPVFALENIISEEGSAVNSLEDLSVPAQTTHESIIASNITQSITDLVEAHTEYTKVEPPKEVLHSPLFITNPFRKYESGVLSASGSQGLNTVVKTNTDIISSFLTSSDTPLFSGAPQKKIFTQKLLRKTKKLATTRGAVGVSIGSGTIISTLSGDILDPSSIGIYSADSQIFDKAVKFHDKKRLKKTKKESTSTQSLSSTDVFEFGILGRHLVFSKPVKLTLKTPNYSDGIILDIAALHAGNTDFNTSGLSVDPNTSCLSDGSASIPGYRAEVQGGEVTFYTCGASSFTVNPVGGTATSNDLKLMIGDYGQIQIYYKGLSQVYGGNPPATGGGSPSLWPRLNIGTTSVGNGGTAWTTATTSGSQLGNTYTAKTILTYGTAPNQYMVVIDWNYVSPNMYFTWKYTLTVPPSNTQNIRFYLGMDSYVAGADANDVGYYSTSPTQTVGIYDSVAKVLSAQRYISGATWAGYYAGPYSTASSTISSNLNYNNTIQSTAGDLGYGINWDFGTASGTYTSTTEWRLLPYVTTTAFDLLPSIGQPSPSFTVNQVSNIPVSLYNAGNTASTGTTTVTFTVPTNFIGPSTSFTNNGWSCGATIGATVTCTKIPNIAILGTDVVQIPITPLAGAAGTTANFSVTASTPADVDTTNNTATTSLQVAVAAQTQLLWLRANDGATKYANVPAANRTSNGSWSGLTPATSVLSSTSSWSVDDNTLAGRYLQLDLGGTQAVKGVVTKGRGDAAQWVTAYTIQYSTDNVTYTQIGGTYTANIDQNTEVPNFFPNLINARYLRIIPTGYSGHKSLRADVIVSANGGDAIAFWQNQMSTEHAIQSTSGNQPVLTNSVMNFNPVIRFSSANSNWMSVSKNFPETDVTQFVVFRSSASAGAIMSHVSPLSPTAGSNDRHIHLSSGKLGNRIWSEETIYTPNTVNNGIPRIATVRYGTSNAQSISIDGKMSVVGTKTASDFTTENGIVLGGHTSWGYLNGDIAEILYYSKILSVNERNITESYLALKYGITLDQTAASSYLLSDGSTAWDATVAGIYNKDIAGIGSDITTTLYQPKSQSANNASDITVEDVTLPMIDKRTLVWGNNAGSISTTSLIPNSQYVQLGRVWFFEENNGDTGNIKISYPASAFPSGFSQPILIVSASPTFNGTTMTSISGALVGSNWEFSLNVSDASYITFGRLADTVPPSITSNSLASGSLMPNGNFSLNITYSDTGTINTGSLIYNLYAWDAGTSTWTSTNLASTYLSTVGTPTINTGTIQSTNLPYGKYRIDVSISDIAGNTTTQSYTYFVDAIEWSVSSAQYDIGTMTPGIQAFGPGEMIVTVKTLGAPFVLNMVGTNTLAQGSQTFNYWNGSLGWGYDQFLSGVYDTILVSHATSATLALQSRSLNQNGQKNTYTYKIKFGGKASYEQAAGVYQGNISFSLTAHYQPYSLLTYSGTATNMLIAQLAGYGILLDPTSEKLYSMDGVAKNVTITARLTNFSGTNPYIQSDARTITIPATGGLSLGGWVGTPVGLQVTSIN